jgi:hypothetical protein
MFAAFPSYFPPTNSLEAVRLLEQFNERAVILAGGTLTMPEINLGSSDVKRSLVLIVSALIRSSSMNRLWSAKNEND